MTWGCGCDFDALWRDLRKLPAMTRSGVVPIPIVTAFLLVAAVSLSSGMAQAQCVVNAGANDVSCGADTGGGELTVTVNTNSAARHFIFPNGAATGSANDNIGGFGLSITTQQNGATLTFMNDTGNIAPVFAPSFGGTAALNLATNNGAVSYSGAGTVNGNDNDFGTALLIDTGSGNVSVNVGSGGLIIGTTAIDGGNSSGLFNITNDGTITGAVDVEDANPASTFQNNGVWNVTGDSRFAGTFVNAAGATIDVSGGNSFANRTDLDILGSFINIGEIEFGPGYSKLLSVASDVVNNGVFTIEDGADVEIVGNSINNGSMTFEGSGTLLISGNLTNNNLINMANGITDNVVTVTGDYVGNFDGTNGAAVAVDVDLFNNTSDTLIVQGNVNGGAANATYVDFTVGAMKGWIKDPITVVDLNGIQSGQFIGEPIDDYGIITYSFGQDGNGDWVLTSGISDNSAANVLTNLAGALGNVTAGFHEPASNDVRCTRTGATNQYCSGIWARANGAEYDLASRSHVVDPVRGRDLGIIATTQRLSYWGLQSGLDFGLLNIDGSGWDAHLGVTGGQITGDVDQIDGKVGSTDFEIPFVGVYAILSDGKFTLDLTARKEFYDIEFTNANAGLDELPVDGDAESYNATASYKIKLDDSGIFLVPFAAITYSQSEVDDFDIVGGVISPGDEETVMFRGGARLAALVQTNNSTFVQPFVGFSFWENFENESDAEFHAVNDAVLRADTQSADAFYQFEGGIGVVNVENNFSGYLRGVYRDGDDLEGYGVTVGGRIDLSAVVE